MPEQVGNLAGDYRRRPTRRLIYFTLAALNLIAIVLCLGLNHHLANLYSDSVALNSRWAGKLDRVSKLEILTSAANVNVNDVMVNHLPDKQAALFEADVREFNDILGVLRDDLTDPTVSHPAQTGPIIDLLNESRDGMRAMTTQAEQLFQLIREGGSWTTSPAMTDFEHHCAATGRTLASVRGQIAKIKDDYLNKQSRTAQFICNLEIIIGSLVITLILAISYHGHRTSIAMRRVDDERDLALIELKNQKRALDKHSIVTITDIRGNITYANDKMCELSGYTQEELIGANHRLLKSGEHPPALYQNLWEAISQGHIWRGEIKNRAKDGGYYWVDATIIPFKDENNRITQYTAIRTDITALKEAEEHNKRQAARLETATEGAHVGIWELEIDTSRVLWDSTMHHLYGIRPEQSKPDHLYQLWHSAVHPDDVQRVERELGRAIDSDHPFDAVFRIIRPDNGQTRYIKTSATIERNAQGGAVSMIGVNWDVTDNVTASQEIERREEEIRGILDAIPAFVYYKDAHNTILRLNSAAAKSIGKPAHEIENHKTEEFFPAEDAETYLRDDREVISNCKPKLGIIEAYDTGGKDPRIIYTDKIPLRNAEGVYDRLVAIATDITEQTDSEKKLKQSEERYALAVRGSRDGLWDWDLIADSVYYAPRWKQMLGLKDETISDSPDEWISRIDERDMGAFMQEFDQHLRGEDEVFEVELRMRHYNGHTIWMLCRGAVVRDDRGRAIRVAGSLADINEIKQVQDELRRIAEHDRLTGLPNRKLFQNRLNKAVERGRQNQDFKFAVLFFDFDRFKVINDSLGHDVGDALLIDIADQFRRILRDNDTAARFGGDEFVVLLNDLKSYDEALLAGNRLLNTFAKPHRLMGHEVISTASIGLVTNESGYANPDDMLRDADAAMYQAKEAGKARIIVFDQQMHQQALDRLQMEADLREALQNDEFHLVYQPIISLEAGELHGFEALLRWDHPKRGTVSPADFIPIAEDTGLIVPIGEWVLRNACRQLYKWNYIDRPELPITLNVNLSMRQVCHPNIIETIRSAVEDAGIETQHLKLEVTESTIIDDRHDMVPLLNQIKDLGISLAMDDFGTGHSSLGNLHRLPVDVLKIDQSFIKSMSANRQLAAVMHAIITLAHELGMQTVAEGIETPEQLVMLQSLDCNFGQGYYFKRPMKTDQATRYLLGMDDNAASA
jgi:diguanylate cyclase (GGDEF)-like protein/PAS domain S-box-containing protein